MKFIPKRKQILGRTVDVQESREGIALPDEVVKHVTCFVHVDDVGPEVTQAKTGDLILHKRLLHVFLRDNTHVVLVDDEDVLCVIETTPEERRRMSIEGSKDYEGGRIASLPTCPACLKRVTRETAADHVQCFEDLEAARAATAACGHAEVNEHGICLGCGGLRGDDGTFEPPVRPFRRDQNAVGARVS